MNGVHCIAMVIIGALALLTSLVLITGSGEGATITVDDDGEGDYTSIQDAIDNATEGDTIEVREGTYFENVVVNKSIDLVGDSRDSVIINGSGIGNVVTIESDGVNLSGFTLTGSGTQLKAGVIIRANFTRVSWNQCYGNSQGINLEQAQNNTVMNNICKNNSNDGIWVIYMSHNNVIAENDCNHNGIGIMSTAFSDNNTISNNSCSWNTKYGIFIGISELTLSI